MSNYRHCGELLFCVCFVLKLNLLFASGGAASLAHLDLDTKKVA